MSGYSRPRATRSTDATDDFDCTAAELNDYLHNRALANDASGASRCYVTCLDGHVVGYYALASGSVYHQDVTGRYRRNMPNPVPAVLLTRLAVDTKAQGQGVGAQLLRDAILRTLEAADIIGVRAMLETTRLGTSTPTTGSSRRSRTRSTSCCCSRTFAAWSKAPSTCSPACGVSGCCPRVRRSRRSRRSGAPGTGAASAPYDAATGSSPPRVRR